MKNGKKLEIIISTVNDYFIENNLFKGPINKSRRRDLVVFRQIIYYFARKHTTLSLKEIGKTTFNQDHATVIHGVKMINDLISVDKEYAKIVDELQCQLNGKFNNNILVIGDVNSLDTPNIFNKEYNKNINFHYYYNENNTYDGELLAYIATNFKNYSLIYIVSNIDEFEYLFFTKLAQFHNKEIRYIKDEN